VKPLSNVDYREKMGVAKNDMPAKYSHLRGG